MEFSQEELSLPVASYLWSCAVSIVQRQRVPVLRSVEVERQFLPSPHDPQASPALALGDQGFRLQGIRVHGSGGGENRRTNVAATDTSRHPAANDARMAKARPARGLQLCARPCGAQRRHLPPQVRADGRSGGLRPGVRSSCVCGWSEGAAGRRANPNPTSNPKSNPKSNPEPKPKPNQTAKVETSWKLANGVVMPTLALNTAGLSADGSERALTAALGAGFTHVDFHPGIERDGVARAIATAGLTKSKERLGKLFLTTKIAKPPIGSTPAEAAERVRRQIDEDFAVLGVDSVEMIMLRDSPDCDVMRAQWGALEEAGSPSPSPREPCPALASALPSPSLSPPKP